MKIEWEFVDIPGSGKRWPLPWQGAGGAEKEGRRKGINYRWYRQVLTNVSNRLIAQGIRQTEYLTFELDELGSGVEEPLLMLRDHHFHFYTEINS